MVGIPSSPESSPTDQPPKLTVAIPVYNGEAHIQRCIDSVLAQTYLDLEILLLDNGSTDGTPDILKAYRGAHPERIFVDTHSNLGVAGNRNLAIDLAKGKYIMFIDADDYVQSDYCEVFVKAIEQFGCDDVRGGYLRIGESGRILNRTAPPNSDWAKYLLVTPWAKIHRTAFLRENNIRFADSYGEDIVFCVKSALCTNKVEIIPYTGYFWYFNENSITNTLYRGFDPKVNVIEMLEAIEAIGGGQDDYSEYFLVRCCIYYLLWSGRHGTSQDFMKVEELLFRWLQLHFPGSLGNRYLIWGPHGEYLKTKFIVSIFMILRKTRLLKLFSRFYCLGGRRSS